MSQIQSIIVRQILIDAARCQVFLAMNENGQPAAAPKKYITDELRTRFTEHREVLVEFLSNKEAVKRFHADYSDLRAIKRDLPFYSEDKLRDLAIEWRSAGREGQAKVIDKYLNGGAS